MTAQFRAFCIFNMMHSIWPGFFAWWWRLPLDRRLVPYAETVGIQR